VKSKKDNTFATVKFTRLNATVDLGFAKVFVGFGNPHIPDDCIDSKRYAFFMARAVMKVLVQVLRSRLNPPSGELP
jgi:hypothetical protein